MTSNCHTFFLRQLQKSVTIWEHLPKRYHFWTIIKKGKMGKMYDNLECDNLRSWTVSIGCLELLGFF